jgi:hypothetical protein
LKRSYLIILLLMNFFWAVVYSILHWGQLLGSIAIVAGLVLGLSRQIHRPPHAGSAEHSLEQ